MKADEVKMEVIASEPTEVHNARRRAKKTRRGKKRRFCRAFGEVEDNVPAAISPTKNGNYSPEISKPPVKLRFARKERSLCPSPCKRVTFEQTTTSADAPATTPVVAASPSPHGFGGRFLRPLEVPKAPNNSTQFIIDDHENCILYLSFESPELSRKAAHAKPGKYGGSNPAPCSGYHDIDYEYESPDDLDTTAFFEKDFDDIYRGAREEELQSMSREGLIEQLIHLEEKATFLESKIVGQVSPVAPSISHLQEELLRLQEENEMLKKSNRFWQGAGTSQSCAVPSHRDKTDASRGVGNADQADANSAEIDPDSDSFDINLNELEESREEETECTQLDSTSKHCPLRRIGDNIT